MSVEKGVVMLTWHVHRRTRQLCASLNIPLVELYTDRVRMSRYLHLISQTVGVIRRKAPSVLIVQNPSLVLALFCCCVKWFMHFRLVVDAHNEAIVPFVYDRRLVRAISRLVIRRAELTIVTNTSLAQQVRAIGGRPFVLPDAIPNVPGRSDNKEENVAPYALVVSTVAPDEPLHLIVKANIPCLSLLAFDKGSFQLEVSRHAGTLVERFGQQQLSTNQIAL